MSTATLSNPAHSSPRIESVTAADLSQLEHLLDLIDFRNAVLSCVTEWLFLWRLSREIALRFERSPRKLQVENAARFKEVFEKIANQGDDVLKLALEKPCSIQDDHFRLATNCAPGDVRACVEFLRDRLKQHFEQVDEKACEGLWSIDATAHESASSV